MADDFGEFHKTNGSKNLSPECIKIDTFYAYTIAPADNHQYWNAKSSEERLESFGTYWQAYIQVLTAEITCITEITALGRLHFHGTVRFKTQKNINDYFVNNVYQLHQHCRTMIVLIKDEGWDAYLSKGSHMIKLKIQTTDANIKRLTAYVEASKKLKLKPPVVKHLECFNVDPNDEAEDARLEKKRDRSIERQRKAAIKRAEQLKEDLEDVAFRKELEDI